jgi:hypothetical protein
MVVRIHPREPHVGEGVSTPARPHLANSVPRNMAYDGVASRRPAARRKPSGGVCRAPKFFSSVSLHASRECRSVKPMLHAGVRVPAANSLG